MRSLLLATLLLACSERMPDAALSDPGLGALAGAYVRGADPNWDEKLALDAEGRFDRRYSSNCTGQHQYSGSASVEAGRLVLHGVPADPQAAASIETMGLNRFHVVPWSGRVYLVEEAGIQGFCNWVNQGREPRDARDGSFLMRDGDWLLPASGLPDVPPDWKHLLLERELDATITELVDDAGRIEFGLDDGLREGMVLVARDVPTPPDFVARGAGTKKDVTLEIVELHPDWCLVLPTYFMTSPPLEVGMRVTSRAVDR